MLLTDKDIQLPRKFMARVVFAWILLLLVYLFTTNGWVHQWERPVLIYPEADNTYWLLHGLNIPQALMRSSTTALVFDLVLFISVLIFLVNPGTVIFCITSCICLWLYQVMYSSANGHHYHHVGILLLPLPFIFRDARRFYLSWETVRYWVLFLFVCAGVYKIYYGGIFHASNMASILKIHFTAESSSSATILYLIQHPSLAQGLYAGATCLQLFCLVGFFTKRLDSWIFAALLVFNIANIFLLQIPFFENSLVLAPFLPWTRVYPFLKMKR